MSRMPVRRVTIDRLDLDLRGIEPRAAETAARALGPAIERALGSRGPDTGNDLAATIARRVARTIREEAG
jgi:hypothetical protein